ncbi:response regulator receiver domain [Marinoscillum sp.]|uniref:response regulator receiver domain n=1 Tax=Marinoscillum sp. TaxID=2024838 RepID=UPI003BAAD8F0
MNSPFFESSKNIADQFIKTVLFVDDEIYPSPDQTDKNHNLDGLSLMKVFSKAKKLCALNNPSSEGDLMDVIDIAQNTDITILDWKLNLEAKVDPRDEEKDIEEDDPRGTFTLKLINELFDNQSKSLKLLLIYTGEPGLRAIVETVYLDLKPKGFQRITDRIIAKDNFRIVIVGKPTLSNRLKHDNELRKWIVDYEQIPEFLLTEITKMTEGLVSNFALQCLNVIRQNNFRILQLFNKGLDPAFLGHKVLLPDQEDANDQLVELMKDSIGDLLHYFKAKFFISENLVKLWIKERVVEESRAFVNNKGKQYKSQKNEPISEGYTVNATFLNQLIFSKESDVDSRFQTAFKKNNLDSLGLKENKKEFLNFIQTKSTSLFLPEDSDIDEVDQEFAKLTHHKNLFKPKSYEPKLTLGTVVKGLKTGNYWVCIQQRCDSVRLEKAQTRRFLFLPLRKAQTGMGHRFDFLTPDNTKLRLVNKSYELRTIKFIDHNGDGFVKAKFDGSTYIFEPEYYTSAKKPKAYTEETFEWLFDLKDLHAQRIAHSFAAQISRVGLDETEWLRRWAT